MSPLTSHTDKCTPLHSHTREHLHMDTDRHTHYNERKKAERREDITKAVNFNCVSYSQSHK